MHKLPEVEEARKLLNEAKAWSIWKWLLRKPHVRTVADAGTAALDEAEKVVKAAWSEDLRLAYREADLELSLNGDQRHKRQYEKAKEAAARLDPKLREAARRVRKADQEATEAREHAEAIFVEAERKLSGGLARQGAERALEAYDLREKAIRKAESANRVN